MSLIRITRGVPKFNIQIGPISQAMHHNPTGILSVTDYFETSIICIPYSHWIPINEISKNWGYQPFFAVKRILDYYCLYLKTSLMFVGCSAGKHRSPMSVFAWLMSLPHDGQATDRFGGTSPEAVAKHFYGDFSDCLQGDLAGKYYQNIQLGYIPDRLPEMYQLMRQFPTASFRDIMNNMLLVERITYIES